MCLPPIQESFHEDVSEHSALSKRSLQQLTSHLTRTRTGSAGTEQIPSLELPASIEGYRALRNAAPGRRYRSKANASGVKYSLGSLHREEKMQMLLHAGFVSVDEINFALIVGFADRQFDTSRYLILQRSLNADNDEGVYLEHNNQACSAYGTVSRCLLSDGRIEMTVDDTTAHSLGTEVTFAIGLPDDPAVLHRLRTGLERILAGTACQIVLKP
jgi:hypothetical protein